MRITEVYLKNVKSYQEATIRFPVGTIAIFGPNGAGKTTILEAIGFALFDFLPYRNQREFMRHNALEADVRVTFLSRLDECEYQAVRTLKRSAGSADSVTSTYYVYSFDREGRVAQQKQDVQAFLRQHIGLDEYEDLARVFADVLGVPQGRLTADFLLTPSQRKDTFDPLLRVDAYRQVYERLRDVLDALRGNVSDQERRVSALEPEAERLPNELAALAVFVKQHAETTQEIRILAADQARLHAEQQRLETQRQTLEQQREQVRRLTQQQQDIQNRLEAERAQAAAAALAEARTNEAAAGYVAYRKAQDELTTLEEDRKSADELRQNEFSVERKLVALRTRQTALAKGVQESSDATAKRTALEPQVARQERLEAQFLQFGRDLDYVRQHGEQVTQILRRVAAGRSDGLRELASADLPAAPSEAAGYARARLSEQHEDLREIGLWLERRDDLRKRFTQTQPKRDETAKAIAHCESFVAIAAQLEGLEQQLQSVRDQLSAYEAQRRFNQDSQAMAADGLCPFYKDFCPKVEEGQSLIPIIAGLVRDQVDQADKLQAERARIEQEVGRARAAQKEVDRLGDLAPRLQHLERDLHDFDQQQQDLTRRIDDRLQGAWSEQVIAKVLRELEEKEETLRQELRSLGNPRQIADRLYDASSEHEERAESLAAVTRELRTSEEELAGMSERLEPYADLDRRVAQQRQIADTHRNDFEVYLQHEQIAADLPRRKGLVASLAGDKEKNARAVAESQQLLTTCEESWNPAALSEIQKNLNKAQVQLGAANERSRYLSKQILLTKQEIAALEESAREMEDAKQALAAAQEVFTVTAFLRNVIRDAGPHIARHLIQQISAEANTLFSEIMGDASAELSLTEDYDILLEQHGHRRAFLQLSGGEQMSAAVAVRLGLLRQLSDINIAFFDEPTQNMDAERRHNLAEQLERVTGFQQLFVISHDDTFEPMVSSVVRVRKENGVSTAEVE